MEDGKAIRFSVEDAQWTCPLATYECRKDPAASRDAKRSAIAEQALGCACQRTQPVSERCFDRHIAATHARRRGRLGLRDSTAFAARDGRSGNRRREATRGGVLVARFLEVAHLSHRFAKLRSLHQPAICSAGPTAAAGIHVRVSTCPARCWRRLFRSSSIFSPAKRIDVEAASIELPFQDGPGFEWFPDSKSFYYDYDERGYKAKELRVVDASTGEQKVLVREQSDSYVDPGETFYRFVEATGEILWTFGARRLESSVSLQPKNRTAGESDHAGSVGGARRSSTSTRRIAVSTSSPTDARRTRTRTRRTCTASGSMARDCSYFRRRMPTTP